MLQYFISYSNYCNRNPFMHYRIRANVYKLLGRGVVGSCLVSTFVLFFGGRRGGLHVGKSSVVALVFGFGMDLCQTSVILNHCIKRGFLYKLQCSCGWYRALFTGFEGMLVSRIGGGSDGGCLLCGTSCTFNYISGYQVFLKG